MTLARNAGSCILHYQFNDGSYEMKFLSTASRTNVSVIEWYFSAFDALEVGNWKRIAMTIDANQPITL